MDMTTQNGVEFGDRTFKKHLLLFETVSELRTKRVNLSFFSSTISFLNAPAGMRRI